MPMPRLPFRIALIVVGAFQALSALGGGIGLLVPGSMGMPLWPIEGAGFTSFLWPALILIVIVGGTQLAAVVTAWIRARGYLFWSAVAGFGMLIWIYVEVWIMDTVILLHTIYFVSGLLQLILTVALAGVLPGVIAPERRDVLRKPE